ncbi:hypothetical protein ACJ73_07975 [Blastomyces percursus]|uniref:Xylanolytic transcriptional activator regulatory domain-containing protein n=1 Tax=Blastomyces percursus TaxID=1658174 RepID=A0A1J9PWG5_9EURO|nr:hypothetical protein ACJ73_07975 [Blastomyces percursus]
MFHTFEGFENPNIRCDGEQPCEACQWYKKTDLCHYSDPRPSRRHVEKLSSTLDEYRCVMEKLFPDIAVESLANLSRENLLELIADRPPKASLSPLTSPQEESTMSPLSLEDENLESLQTMPDESGDSQESEGTDSLVRISDDINALSLSLKQSSTYLGISSVMAVMRVIMWIDPNSASAPQIDDENTRSPPKTIRGPRNLIDVSRYPQSQSRLGRTALDEAAFRGVLLKGNRTDRRWMGLLNMVFALGSIATYPVDDRSHDLYYRRARQYLTLDSLDSAQLETVQTLALMGRFYLHYGIRWYGTAAGKPNHTQSLSVDIRRRVWWSLFCLDTWAHMTLGRPSLGRWGHGITAKLPQYLGDRENALGILPLVENSHFCRIATQVGDALATSPLGNYAEMASLVLLSYAMRRVPYVALREEERSVIEKCRTVAHETIRDISSATRVNKMTGWNAVWFIFQASLVPVLGLFMQITQPSMPRARSTPVVAQVEIVMVALVQMQLWSPAAKRTLEIVSRIFDAVNRSHGEGSERSTIQTAAPAGHPISTTQGLQPPNYVEQVPLLNGRNLTASLIEYSGPNMWDYLTWSDRSLWAGFTGDPTIPQEALAVYGVDENFLKYHEANAISETAYGGYPVTNRINFQ